MALAPTTIGHLAQPVTHHMQIYECIYQENMRVSDPDTTPLMVENSRPERRELQAYVQAFRQGIHLRHERIGVFSPKFSLKTKVSVAEFRRFCMQHPSVNTCHINPFPQIRYWSYNVWEQGEEMHPGLISNAQALLDAIQIPIDLKLTPRHDSRLLAYCNFWVADRNFWEQYVGNILIPISDFLDQEPKHPAAKGIMAPTQHTLATPLLPFLIERLYSTWISMHPEHRVAAYPIEHQDVLERYCLNDYERLMVKQMHRLVDQCDSQGDFPHGVRQRLSDMCALHRCHMLDYYEYRPFPHSGQPIARLI